MHTLGPWHIMPGPIVPGIQGLGIFGADGSPIASVYHTFKDRERDNANLLWAALDLLEACESFLKEYEEVSMEMHFGQMLDSAFARPLEPMYEAIAKARGEQ